MRYLKYLLLFFMFGTATAANFKANVDYLVLEQTQPIRVEEGKIEVLEFFNYSCPHCNRLQPLLRRWERTQKEQYDDVSVVGQPVVFQRFNGHFARLHYTLDSMDLLDSYQAKVYKAIHTDRKLINNKSRFLDWLEDDGIERARADAVYQSFSVHSKVTRAEIMANDYNVTGTPQIAVGGKYLVNASMARGYERMMDIVTWLVEQERNQNKI